ncbi:uncharacterized protein LOC135112515 [Scylla paramamosain]|uniref:uncharacterized protein LOC135112515 n=1 Tax=Scylla paramamosain TaxID=85552 RepID=UPI00308285FB
MPGSQYKSLLVCYRTTSEELVQLLLNCYNSKESPGALRHPRGVLHALQRPPTAPRRVSAAGAERVAPCGAAPPVAGAAPHRSLRHCAAAQGLVAPQPGPLRPQHRHGLRAGGRRPRPPRPPAKGVLQ